MTDPASSPNTVHYEANGGVATLTLDAPARRNALSAPLLTALGDGLDRALADDGVRCVVLSHTGTVFCSGMDLTQVADVPAEQQPIVAFPALLQRLWFYDKPVLARVKGKARAGGVGLIAACDLAIGANDADFALTEVRLGLVPAVISSLLLPLLDPRALMRVCLTGEVFGAAAAAEMGLLTEVAEDVDAATRRYTDLLLLAEPGALATTKSLLRRPAPGSRTDADPAADLAADFAAMSRLSARHFAGEAGQEGIAAFAAKRPPRWVLPTER